MAMDMQGQGNGAEGHLADRQSNVYNKLHEKILHI